MVFRHVPIDPGDLDLLGLYWDNYFLDFSSGTKIIKITKDFKQDLNWFKRFLMVYNGVSFFNYTPSKLVHLDACPSGLGAIFNNQVYAITLPSSWQGVNIAYMEMINILVALKVWHKQWSGQKVLPKYKYDDTLQEITISCDKKAVVSVLNTGKTRGSTLAKYARNIFFWLSACNINNMVLHVPGKMNPVADLLSRWGITANNVSKLQQLAHPVTRIPTSQDRLYCDDSI